MVNEKLAPGQGDNFRFPIIEAVVIVAEDGGDGSDLFELKNDPRQADVAGVEDVFDAGEEFGDARVEVIMGVRDDADFHFVNGKGRAGEMSLARLRSRFFRSRGFFVLRFGFTDTGFFLGR